MRRSCASIDLRNYKTLMPWVWDCIQRHYDRFDFRDMLFEYSISQKTYAKVLETQDPRLLYPAVEPIAKEAARRILSQNLDLKPVHIQMRMDHSTGKIRPIGREEPMQQIFDTIAVYASAEIWRRRIVLHQVSSIKGRGPLYGTKIIQHWIMEDNRAERYAKAHDLRYAPRCKYHTKNDIRKCFPSARAEVFMALFRKDCANQDLLWLWETLLCSHRVEGYQGFMIGSLVSQWAMQYMLSFAYRYAMEQATVRRGKRIKTVSHAMFFMDDFLFTGSNRKNIKSTIRKIAKFAKEKMGLTMKDNWHIKELEKEPIDMMGYVAHRNGKITIRARNFLRGRRLVLIYYREHALTLQQARRLSAYKGFFKHTKITHIKKWKNDMNKIPVAEAFDYAAGVISRYDREVNNGRILRKSTIQRTAGAGKVQNPSGRESGRVDPA